MEFSPAGYLERIRGSCFLDGVTCEPVEEVVCDVPNEYSGTVISALNIRKGMLQDMEDVGSYTRVTYLAPTRGLIGYRTEFINSTRGEGTMVRRLAGYEPWKGDIPQRENGALISTETGGSMILTFSNLLFKISSYFCLTV